MLTSNVNELNNPLNEKEKSAELLPKKPEFYCRHKKKKKIEDFCLRSWLGRCNLERNDRALC